MGPEVKQNKKYKQQEKRKGHILTAKIFRK
jgi:hypothetical protein